MTKEFENYIDRLLELFRDIPEQKEKKQAIFQYTPLIDNTIAIRKYSDWKFIGTGYFNLENIKNTLMPVISNVYDSIYFYQYNQFISSPTE